MVSLYIALQLVWSFIFLFALLRPIPKKPIKLKDHFRQNIKYSLEQPIPDSLLLNYQFNNKVYKFAVLSEVDYSGVSTLSFEIFSREFKPLQSLYKDFGFGSYLNTKINNSKDRMYSFFFHGEHGLMFERFTSENLDYLLELLDNSNYSINVDALENIREAQSNWNLNAIKIFRSKRRNADGIAIEPSDDDDFSDFDFD